MQFFRLVKTDFLLSASFRRVETAFLSSVLFFRTNLLLVEAVIKTKVKPFLWSNLSPTIGNLFSGNVFF